MFLSLKLGVRFYSCLRLFMYLMYFMKEGESLSYKAVFNFVPNERVNAFCISSTVLCNAFCTDFVWIELN